MKIEILGAHNIASKDTGCISLLIDGILAIDAGSLTSGLSLAAQQKLQAVLLTHQHYDHIRDIPALGINFYLQENAIDVYATRQVLEIIKAHLMNHVLYPDYTVTPPEKPAVRLHTVTPGRATSVAGYSVLPVPVKHAVPTNGYQVTAADRKKVFYTSDTGPGLTDTWQKISPELLLIEVTGSDWYIDFARQSGHLTPSLLQQELESFREINGYLPQIVLIHMNPFNESKIKEEIKQVEASLQTEMEFGYEGMTIEI
jgi:phosphoribosyl 1,2-cyclic phosphodiesterase